MTGLGRVGRNALAGVIGQICGLAVAFITTPILVHGLGAAHYGLWNVAGAVGTWVGFVNLVLATSTIRFIGQSLGAGDRRAADDAYRAMTVWGVVCAVIASVIIVGCAPWLAGRVLNVPASDVHLAMRVLDAQAIVIGIQLLIAVAHGVVAAHQRLEVHQAIRTVSTVVQSGGAAVLVVQGHGLLAVVWWVVATQALEWAAFLWWAHRLQPSVPGLRLGPALTTWRTRLVAYGGPLFLGFLAEQLFLPATRILLGMLRPVEEVAYFAVPATLAGHVRLLSTHIAVAVLPASSERAGQQDPAALRELYLRALRWTWLALIPMAAITMALGGPFLLRWVGPQFGQYAAPLVVPLVLGLGVYYIGGIPAVIAQGIGSPGSWTWVNLCAGLVNVLIALWLIPGRGARGAAEALAVAGVIFTVLMLRWAHRVLRVQWSEYLPACDPRILLVSAGIGCALAVVVRAQTPSFFRIFGLAAAGVVVLLAVAPWLLQADERTWCRRQWHALRAGRGGVVK